MVEVCVTISSARSGLAHDAFEPRLHRALVLLDHHDRRGREARYLLRYLSEEHLLEQSLLGRSDHHQAVVSAGLGYAPGDARRFVKERAALDRVVQKSQSLVHLPSSLLPLLIGRIR